MGALTGLMVLGVSGCATGYKDFYRAENGMSPDFIAVRRISPPPTTPKLERALPENTQLILPAYAKRGYTMIGQSTFNSGKNESENSAIQQGRDVGADLVLILNPKHTGSVTTSIPITTPTTSTAYTSGTATAYGAGAPVTAYGNSTTTTYGTTTNYIPITVNRTNYAAVYFVKLRTALGIFFRDLNDSERQELQTNKGVFVSVIVDGSPAFDADMLVGDIITTIDGKTATNTLTLTTLLRERVGQNVTIGLIRRGKQLEKSIQLGT